MKDYIWFGIKVNLYLFLITIVVTILSAILLIPIGIVLAAVQSLAAIVAIGTIWIGVLTIVPYFFAFRSVYRKSNLNLYEAIGFALGIKIIIDVILTYFTEEYIDPTMTIINIGISTIIAGIVFYYAGVKYQPHKN
jgi:hypothetical protein